MSRGARLTLWQQTLLFPLILYFMEPFFTVSFRSQLVSLTLTALVYCIFSSYKKGSRGALFFLPLLFLFWANFHGGFILGLGVLTIWVIISIIIRHPERSRGISHLFRANINGLIILLLCYLVPLLNPFGIEIYLETFRHLGNPLARYISEWTAFDSYSVYWWRLLSWGLYLSVSLYYLKKTE
jgi:hypothetical protein